MLELDGVLIGTDSAKPMTFQFDPELEGGKYVRVQSHVPVHQNPITIPFNSQSTRTFDQDIHYTRQQLAEKAIKGSFLGTFTARLANNNRQQNPQPALWTEGDIHSQRGHQRFPFLYEGRHRMKLSGHHIDENARVIVNGRAVEGIVETSDGNRVEIELAKLPEEGIHMLQVQNPNGLFSNDFIFRVTKDRAESIAVRLATRRARVSSRVAIWEAVNDGDFKEVKRLVARGSEINSRHPESGNTPLGQAVTYGHLDIAKYLIEKGARVSGSNRDGNTPLHIAAFFCDFDIARLLLEQGANRGKKNRRGENALDVVSGWSEQTANFYRAVGPSVNRELVIEQLPNDRKRMAKLIEEFKSTDL